MGHFKKMALRACGDVCRKKMCRNTKGETWWLNEEMKEGISGKKDTQKAMCRSSTDEYKNRYILYIGIFIELLLANLHYFRTHIHPQLLRKYLLLYLYTLEGKWGQHSHWMLAWVSSILDQNMDRP